MGEPEEAGEGGEGVIVRDVEQRSEAWKACRIGRLTGSRAKDAFATVQKGEAAARRDLRFALAIERLTGLSQESDYVNADMAWGNEHEADAVAAYEAATGSIVTSVGFCEHETLRAGTSPDGFVGDDGAISVKCPRSANHVRYMRAGKEPAEHAHQNTHELWLTGRRWIDFVSFDPRMPEGLQLWILRVTRTPEQIAEYDRDVRLFLAEVDREVEGLSTMANPGRQLAAAVNA